MSKHLSEEQLLRLTAAVDTRELDLGLAEHLEGCPECQQRANVLTDDPAVARWQALAPVGPAVQGYELLGELGRGGMGVVYRARQGHTGRVVALKRIHARGVAAAAELKRFRAETETAAHLDHPNIVPVYEVGEQQGQPYFTMKLLAGGSLTERRADYRKDQRAAAQLLATLARAVHHAHQRGILHRDLKPANVLFDEEGRPHLTDFGLARRVAVTSSLTEPGVIVGTPAYMAPEQARGQQVPTMAVDVYGLGAILYELLTERPPFSAPTPLGVVLAVIETEPLLPRSLAAHLPRDLETVCLKCLHKDPERRYATAVELAEDLERYLTGEPIKARPISAWERSRRWLRRHWAGVALVLALTAGLSASLWQGQEAGAARQMAEQRQRDAEKARGLAEQARVNLQRQLAENHLQRYRVGIRFAHQFLRQRLIEEASFALVGLPKPFRGWEWGRLKLEIERAPRPAAVLGCHDWGVLAGCLRPDGLLATSGHDGRVLLWDTRPRAAGAEPRVVQAGIFSDECLTWRHAVLPAPHAEGQPVERPDCFPGLCWVGNGSLLAGASLDKKGVLWDLSGHRILRQDILRHDRPLHAVAASACGRRLGFGDDSGTLLLLDRTTGGVVRVGLGRGSVLALSALPGSGWVAGQADGTVTVLAPGGSRRDRQKVPGPVWALGVAPDGRELAVACGAARLPTFRIGPDDRLAEHTTYLVPEGEAHAATALHTVVVAGGVICAGDDEGRLLVWQPGVPMPRQVLKDQAGEMLSRLEQASLPLALRRRSAFLARSSGAQSPLFTGGIDTAVKRWHLAEAPGVTTFSVGEMPVARFDHDDPTLLWVGTAEGDLGLWDSRRKQRKGCWTGAHRGPVTGLDYATDGRRAASCGSDGVVRFWRRAGDRIVPAAPPLVCGQPLRCVSLSADGRRVAVYAGDDSVKVWEVASRAVLLDVPLGQPGAAALHGLVALSPDGQRLAATGPKQLFRLFEAVGTGKPARVLDGEQAAGRGATALAWHPTHNNRFLSGDSIGRLRFHPGQPEFSGAVVAPDTLAGVAWSPAGDRVAAVFGQRGVVLFDPVRPVPALLRLPLRPGARPTGVQFDPSSRRLAVVDADGTVVIWETWSPPAGPALARQRSWVVKSLLPAPGHPAADIRVRARNLGLGRDDRALVLFSRPAVAEEDARQRMRPVFLGRETSTGYDEEALGPAAEAALFLALLPGHGEVFAALRRNSEPTKGKLLLFRRRAGDGPLAGGPPEDLTQRPSNWGYRLRLLPGPLRKPAALHFAHEGHYLCATVWTAKGEETYRLGRQGDGQALEAVLAADGRLHLLFQPLRFGGDPHPLVYATARGAPHWRQETREVIETARVHGSRLTLAADGSPVILYARRLGGGGLEWVHARRGAMGWTRSAIPAQALGTVRSPSGLVSDGKGRLYFSYAGLDARRLFLATYAGGTWTSERVWQEEAPEDSFEDGPNDLGSATHLDSRGRLVILAARIHKKNGWVRMWREGPR